MDATFKVAVIKEGVDRDTNKMSKKNSAALKLDKQKDAVKAPEVALNPVNLEYEQEHMGATFKVTTDAGHLNISVSFPLLDFDGDSSEELTGSSYMSARQQTPSSGDDIQGSFFTPEERDYIEKKLDEEIEKAFRLSESDTIDNLQIKEACRRLKQIYKDISPTVLEDCGTELSAEQVRLSKEVDCLFEELLDKEDFNV